MALFLAGQILTADDLNERIGGVRIATTVETVDSATFTAETVVLTVDAPLVAGRTYAVQAFAAFESAVDNDDVDMRIREDGLIGTNQAFDRFELTADNQENVGERRYLYSEFTATATAMKTFVLTGELNSGTGPINLAATAGNRRAYLWVDYISD